MTLLWKVQTMRMNHPEMDTWLFNLAANVSTKKMKPKAKNK